MLLLVLILVLVAFALLVVALVQGSVLWAWLSVAISVAAASALLFDWWQRQRALRAEETPLPAGGLDRQIRPPAARADIDSVTEFIPVVPQPGYAPDVERASAGGPGGGDQQHYPSDADTRFISSGPFGSPAPGAPSEEVEQTVLLPVARPPGSMEQPPGATPPGPPRTSDQSQSVTSPESQPVEHETPAGRPEGTAPGEATILQSDASGPTGLIPHWTNGAPIADRSPTESPPAAPDAAGADAEPEPEPKAAPTVDRDATAGDIRTVAVGDVTSVAPVRSTEHLPPPMLPADAEPEGGAGPALPPAGPDGEPPEEPYVAAAATTVAGLDDEVLVVDERPRYHVAGCPFLPGHPVIPLPAREAVEYGFGPCGWCAPNRVLAERSHSGARQ